MPDKVIDIPGVGSIAFPESMDDNAINAAATKLYQQKNPTAKQPPVSSWVDTAVDWLPTAGGVAGGIIGGAGGTVAGMGVGGVPGAVGGAAVGGAAGEAWKQAINYYRGKATPTTEAGIGGEIAKQAAIQGGSELAGAGVGKAMSAVAPRLMQSAVKPTLSTLKEYKTTAPKLVQTLLDEGINISQRGMEKLQTLFDATNQEIGDAIAHRDLILSRLGNNAVIDKKSAAARALTTAGKMAEQANPTADLKAVGDTVGEFVNHPIYQGNLTLPEAQAIKVGTYREVGKKYGEMASGSVEAQKAIARGLKEEIASEVPNLGALNQRDSELMAAMDAVGRRTALSGNRDPIGFAWVAQHPTTFLSALFDRSPAVKSMLARGLYSSAAAAGRVSPQAIKIALGAIAQSGSGAPDAGPPPE